MRIKTTEEIAELKIELRNKERENERNKEKVSSC